MKIATAKMEDKQSKKRGPVPNVVKIKGDWEDAVKKALEKERPEGGWPKDGDVKDDKAEKRTKKPAK